MFLCLWWKKQSHHTSSESSWNSILPLGVWLVSKGSSIPSPAAPSSTCCCSTEYLCTKNLQPHSEYCQIIGETACRRMTSQTIWWTDLPPQTYFLTNITPAAVLSSITMMTVITMETVLEGGFFTCKCSKINQFRGGRRETDCRILHKISLSPFMRYSPEVLDLEGRSHISAWGWSLYDLGSFLLHIYFQEFSCSCEPNTIQDGCQTLACSVD